MAAYEVLLLNTAIPQIQAAQSGDTYVVPRDIAFSTVASFAAGAEATPSIVATGDTNTGIWFPAADTVAISTGGTSRLRLDSSGNLGLGVTPTTGGYGLGMQISDFGAGHIMSLWVQSINTNDLRNAIANNAYSSGVGTWKYRGTGAAATLYETGAGQHRWSYAATGNANDPISFTQAMTLDASGNLAVGTTTTTTGKLIAAVGNSHVFNVEQNGSTLGASNGVLLTNYLSQTTRVAGINFSATAADAGAIIFGTASGGTLTERARITSGGYFKASNNGTYFGSTSSYHEFNNNANDSVVIARSTNAGSSTFVYQSELPVSAAGNHIVSRTNSAIVFQVAANGNATNTNGSYGTISDQKLKQDIVDAGSQWADIKAIRFRKYRMKSDVAANPDAPYLLGVVAQELEQVSPGLVDEHPDMETVEVTDEDGNVTQTQQSTGTTTKTVKSSILLMKAAVALQEAMARIEKLEAEVAALKGA